MPPTISINAPRSDRAALRDLARLNNAFSSEARDVMLFAAEIDEPALRTQTFDGTRAAAISRLGALMAEFATANWDGDGALPLNPAATRQSLGFLCALPEGFPQPLLCPDPDGSVGLDWIQSRNCMFSISIGASDRLSYAWIDGSDRGHGVARFDGERIPQQIMDGIVGVLNSGSSPLWPR